MNPTLQSSSYGLEEIYKLLRNAQPGSIPSHVINVGRSKQYFCSNLKVAGILIMEFGQGRVDHNAHKDLCNLVPFYPTMYRAEPGALEIILQSGDEALFLMRERPMDTGWSAYWNWSHTFPEYELLFYP